MSDLVVELDCATCTGEAGKARRLCAGHERWVNPNPMFMEIDIRYDGSQCESLDVCELIELSRVS